MNMILAVLVLILAGSPTWAWAGEAVLLPEAELDRLYGGEPLQLQEPMALRQLTESAQAPEFPQGPEVSKDNDVVIRSKCKTCTLNVSESAQENATAVILINAVTSVINAQVNISTRTDSPGTTNQTDVGFTTGATIRGSGTTTEGQR